MNFKQEKLVRIGTSGIVLPGAKPTFPEEYKAGTRLHYYGSLFNTLEVNSSFYKIPLPSTFAKWATEVPDDFKFTVKLWRGITHAKKLAYAVDDIDVFMRSVSHVGEKKGCLLIQFPASITFEYAIEVDKILQRLMHLNTDQQWQLALELRHPSWYQHDAYKMFDRYRLSLVLHDMPTSKTPFDYISGNSLYLRFHGPTGNYNGSYTDEFIADVARQIQLWRDNDKEIYVYFNNTIGSALANAQLLQTLI